MLTEQFKELAALGQRIASSSAEPTTRSLRGFSSYRFSVFTFGLTPRSPAACLPRPDLSHSWHRHWRQRPQKRHQIPLATRCAVGGGYGHSAISKAAPARLGDRIWPCERLPPVSKEVIDPVVLTLFVQTIYEAFTAHGISFYDQPSENADSWKSKREKEKHCQWWYTRRCNQFLRGSRDALR